jgi:hypothetical protein
MRIRLVAEGPDRKTLWDAAVNADGPAVTELAAYPIGGV